MSASPKKTWIINDQNTRWLNFVRTLVASNITQTTPINAATGCTHRIRTNRGAFAAKSSASPARTLADGNSVSANAASDPVAPIKIVAATASQTKNFAFAGTVADGSLLIGVRNQAVSDRAPSNSSVFVKWMDCITTLPVEMLFST